MFDTVEQNMSCLTILDERGVTCGATCKDRFGPATRSLFEPDGGIWRCVCIYLPMSTLHESEFCIALKSLSLLNELYFYKTLFNKKR